MCLRKHSRSLINLPPTSNHVINHSTAGLFHDIYFISLSKCCPVLISHSILVLFYFHYIYLIDFTSRSRCSHRAPINVDQYSPCFFRLSTNYYVMIILFHSFCPPLFSLVTFGFHFNPVSGGDISTPIKMTLVISISVK